MNLIKEIAKAYNFKLQNILIKKRGYQLLSLRETVSFMAPYNIEAIPGHLVLLPATQNCADTNVSIFQAKECITDRVYVWKYKGDGNDIKISKYGSVGIQKKILTTDWNNNSFFKDFWEKGNREAKASKSVIALFSQYQDGVFYGGYYDFVFLVAAKLARIKDTLPNSNIVDKLIVYPLFNTFYEQEYLALLGVDPVNVINSSKVKIATSEVITANSAHWYPNKADIISLKKYIGLKFKPVKTAANRIYISRSGRRRVINENEVIDLLKKFEFLIIEDRERSVTEQIQIYLNASFIIGPHGASFSNIIWCEPGTHLLELFSATYTPDFFVYLATIMDMKYAAFYDAPAKKKVSYLDGLVEDIYVPVEKLNACLQKLLADT